VVGSLASVKVRFPRHHLHESIKDSRDKALLSHSPLDSSSCRSNAATMNDPGTMGAKPPPTRPPPSSDAALLRESCRLSRRDQMAKNRKGGVGVGSVCH
jgi:hypothetical protein